MSLPSAPVRHEPANLTPAQVATRLGVSLTSVYTLLRGGEIPAIQLGSRWLISRRGLEEWLEREFETQTRARAEAAAAWG